MLVSRKKSNAITLIWDYVLRTYYATTWCTTIDVIINNVHAVSDEIERVVIIKPFNNCL